MPTFEANTGQPTWETGGLMQRTIRELAQGTPPTDIYESQLLPQLAYTAEEIQAIDPESCGTDILGKLERDRVACGNYYPAIQALFQSAANIDIAELAASQVSWPELSERLKQKLPDSLEKAEKILPHHPAQLLDYVSTAGSLVHVSMQATADRMGQLDAGWGSAALDARKRFELAYGKMREIIDCFVRADSNLEKEFNSILEEHRKGNLMLPECSGQLTGLLRRHGLKVHPRVMVFELHRIIEEDPEYLDRPLEINNLATRIQNARTTYEIIMGYSGILRLQGVPAEEVVPQLLSPGNITAMAGWSSTTLQYLPFSYVTGAYPHQLHKFADWQARVEMLAQLAERDGDTLLVPSRPASGAKRGRCPVQHSLSKSSDTPADSLSGLSVVAARSLEQYSQATYGVAPQLVRTLYDRHGTPHLVVNISEMFLANNLLLAAKKGGLLDPATGGLDAMLRTS